MLLRYRTKQKVFNAMVTTVDETAKNVSDALKRSDMWDNTLMIWSTDVRSANPMRMPPVTLAYC